LIGTEHRNLYSGRILSEGIEAKRPVDAQEVVLVKLSQKGAKSRENRLKEPEIEASDSKETGNRPRN